MCSASTRLYLSREKVDSALKFISVLVLDMNLCAESPVRVAIKQLIVAGHQDIVDYIALRITRELKTVRYCNVYNTMLNHNDHLDPE